MCLGQEDAADLRARFAARGVADNSHIVVYFGPKTAVQSTTRIILTLDYLGLGDRTSLLNGGLPAWLRAGRPVTTEADGQDGGQRSIDVVTGELAKSEPGRTYATLPAFLDTLSAYYGASAFLAPFRTNPEAARLATFPSFSVNTGIASSQPSGRTPRCLPRRARKIRAFWSPKPGSALSRRSTSASTTPRATTTRTETGIRNRRWRIPKILTQTGPRRAYGVVRVPAVATQARIGQAVLGVLMVGCALTGLFPRPVPLLFAIAAVFGDSVRTRRAYTSQLELRAIDLESNQEAQAQRAVPEVAPWPVL